MKGLINKSMQEMVEASFGTDTWEKIKTGAGCDEPFFALSLDYPDEMTFALVKSASEVLGLPPATVMKEYGKWVIPNSFKTHYPSFFALAGSSTREFLGNMSRIHREVAKSIPGAKPPTIDVEDGPNGSLIVRYASVRILCSVLHGLILGVGLHFGQELEVRETACMKTGAPQCVFEVTSP